MEWVPKAKRYELHDLLREYAAAHLDPVVGNEARRRHAVHYIGVGEEADRLYLQGGADTLRGLKLFDQERAHLEAVFAFLAGNRGLERELHGLVNAVVYVGGLRLPTKEIITWNDAALMAAREIGDRQGECSDLGNLGNAYAALGETRKAIEFYEQALRIYTKDLLRPPSS